MNVLPIPDDCVLRVAPATATRWLEAARSIPANEARRFYEPSVQQRLRDLVRAAAPEELDALIAGVDALLLSPPHLVVVRGLRWDAADHLCVALNAAFGTLVAGTYQPPRSQIVHRLQVQTELAGDKGAMRGAEVFHSDCASFSEPADLLTMVCVRPDDSGGGSTRVVTSAQVRALIRARGGDEMLAWFERTALPWRIRDPGDARRYLGNADRIRAQLGWRHFDERGEGVAMRPVLDGDRVLWSRYLIEQGFLLLERQLDAETARALDFLTEALEAPDEQYDCPLQADDFMISDNLRTLHTRTPLGHDYAQSSRLMLRCWVRRAPS